MARNATTVRSHTTHSHAAPAGATDTNVSSAMDYAAHEATYHRFTSLVKWGIIASVVLVIFLFIAIHPMIETAAS